MPRPKKMLVKPPERDLEAEIEAQIEDEAPESILRLREKRFVVEYVRSLNASDAARKAGYSEASAAVRGYELVRKGKIKEAIAQRVTRLAQVADVDDVWVMQKLKQLHDQTQSDSVKLGVLTQLSNVLGLAKGKGSDDDSANDGIQQIMIFGDKEVKF